MTVHDARRTCATLLVDLEVHPRAIMWILRHAACRRLRRSMRPLAPMATREAQRRLRGAPSCAGHFAVLRCGTPGADTLRVEAIGALSAQHVREAHRECGSLGGGRGQASQDPPAADRRL